MKLNYETNTKYPARPVNVIGKTKEATHEGDHEDIFYPSLDIDEWFENI